MMLTERLAEIRARLEKATPGKWEWCDEFGADVELYGWSGEKWCPIIELEDIGAHYDPWRVITMPNREADQALIAHAPADLRFLLRVVEGMQKIRDRVHAECCKGEAKIQREVSRDGMAVLCGITETLAAVRADIDRIAKEAGDAE